MVRLLKSAEVADLIDLPTAIACLEQTYRQQAEGLVRPAPPSTLQSDGALFMVRAGGLGGPHRLGFRISRARGRGYALVFDSPKGDLLALIDYPFSDLRVSASVAVGIRHLAPAATPRVAVIGSGGIAWACLLGATAVRRPQEVRVYSREQAHRRQFADRTGRELELAARPVGSAREALDGADLALVATNATAPVLEAGWLPASTLLVGAGNRPEFGTDVYARAELIVTTSKQHETNVGDWPLLQAVREGLVRWEDVAEIGEVVVGERRPAGGGLTVLREAQGGFTDIALASLALERAADLGRGLDWALE